MLPSLLLKSKMFIMTIEFRVDLRNYTNSLSIWQMNTATARIANYESEYVRPWLLSYWEELFCLHICLYYELSAIPFGCTPPNTREVFSCVNHCFFQIKRRYYFQLAGWTWCRYDKVRMFSDTWCFPVWTADQSCPQDRGWKSPGWFLDQHHRQDQLWRNQKWRGKNEELGNWR